MKLSKVGLSTIKSQHSKKSDMMDRSHLNQKDMKNCKLFASFFHKRCSKCQTFAWTHAWRCSLHLATAVSIMSGHKLDHRPTLLNCKALSLLRTVYEQKEKC